MIIKFTNSLSLQCVRKLINIHGIKYTSSKRKEFLINFLNLHKSACKIQREFRRKNMKDSICPISHENLKYPFVSFKINNVFVYYDFYSIVKYLNRSEEFKDPCTRQNIDDNKILEINKLIRYYYGKNSNKVLYSQNMLRTSELCVIAFCVNDLINEINRHSDISLDEIYGNFMPRLIHYTHQLYNNHSYEDCKLITTAVFEGIDSDKNKNAELLKDYIHLNMILRFMN